MSCGKIAQAILHIPPDCDFSGVKQRMLA